MNKEFDEILIESLTEYKISEFSAVPAEDEIDYEFSAKFLKEKTY